MQFRYKDTALIEGKEIKEAADALEGYREELKAIADGSSYGAVEASLALPSDTDLLNAVLKLCAEKKTDELKYIFVVGIGGSNLGTKAVYEALYWYLDAYTKRAPKLIFLDTIHSHQLKEALAFIDREIADPGECLAVSVTKSGTTTETAVNFELLFKALAEKFGERDAARRSVAITDEGSKLWDVAGAKDMARLSIPKKVGGRYSVFSAVGLFPLACAGIDVAALREAAVRMRELCLSANSEENPALISAAVIYKHIKSGINIHDSFFFSGELESVGKWYRQLVAESLGKKDDAEGKEVQSGITPTVSIGSTDLHSMVQLYLGGPRDKLTTFAWYDRIEELTIEEPQTFQLVDGIGGRTTKEILRAIYDGTKKAYANEKRPFLEVNIETHADLGAYLQFKMIETMYMGKLLGVNAFDQPAVEIYKEETRKILGGG